MEQNLNQYFFAKFQFSSIKWYGNEYMKKVEIKNGSTQLPHLKYVRWILGESFQFNLMEGSF